MSLYINGSDQFFDIGNDPATLQTKEVHHVSIIAAGVLTLTSLYFLLQTFLSQPRSLTDKAGNKIPAGPWGLPVVGQLHLFLINWKVLPFAHVLTPISGSFFYLTHYPELKLDYWAKKFGDLYSIWLGNQLFLIVSDPVIAKELMVSNGNVFSSRKEMFIKSQTVFAGRGITATPYNERWYAAPIIFRDGFI